MEPAVSGKLVASYTFHAILGPPEDEELDEDEELELLDEEDELEEEDEELDELDEDELDELLEDELELLEEELEDEELVVAAVELLLSLPPPQAARIKLTTNAADTLLPLNFLTICPSSWFDRLARCSACREIYN